MKFRPLPLAFVAFLSVTSLALAQDRLKTMPGYERYTELGRKAGSAWRSGSLPVEWDESGKALQFRRENKTWRYELGAADIVEAPKVDAGQKPPAGRRQAGGPERGRQFSSAPSPDGKLEAFHKDRNLWLRDAQAKNERQITTDGDAQKRTKNAVASWVYGEELDQNTAMWWSPDGTKLGFYRFDESGVRDFYLQMDQTQVQSTMDVEAYPKAGAPNPSAEILVLDIASGKIVQLDTRDGKPFADETVGHYVYGVSWTKDSSELLFHRTNRHQNVMEFCAGDPATGKCRVIVREEWPDSWTENTPGRTWLEDGKRFLWESERTGFRNFYLYDLSGKLLSTVTAHPFEVASVVRIDEPNQRLFYMARSGDNHMKLQLHRVGLDGKGDTRLTDPALHHTVTLAPDGEHFVDVAQTHSIPPVTRLCDAQGKVLRELATSDTKDFDSQGFRRVELFTYKAGDGTTDLHGLLHFPSNFDPSRKYPLLVSVYGGPATNGARETFTPPSGLTEYGFLYATLDSRSAAGRGKRFLDAIYQKLGTVEIDDQAAGVKELAKRPYVNGSKVGIFGTSYGGYVSAVALLRHPDTFHAGVACSPVTDWRHYDTIYTERYMRTPQENAAGYDAGSAVKLAASLKGRLMLFYGTADNNVHPNNTMQLVAALQRNAKSFELQVGPDVGHAAMNSERMMEFFIENLVMR
ncbi:MAG: DPP IV N-terminal domain-containing protein [Planctomycetota bacterium]|nr:DPP IV N-terminal domain-containing protein [Planctomycetota bacterium]